MNQDDNLPADAIAALSQGRSIEAIKIVRMKTGKGLKEAKDSVERYLQNHPEIRAQYRTSQSQETKGALVGVAIVVLAAALYLYIRR